MEKLLDFSTVEKNGLKRGETGTGKLFATSPFVFWALRLSPVIHPSFG
jgi:hypothetical protein